jgi:uncharacterized protein YqgC (DUF456 family)
MATGHFPFITVLVLVPAVGAAVVALVPTRSVSRHFHEGLGSLVMLFTLVITSGPRIWASTGRWASTGSRCSWW